MKRLRTGHHAQRGTSPAHAGMTTEGLYPEEDSIDEPEAVLREGSTSLFCDDAALSLWLGAYPYMRLASSSLAIAASRAPSPALRTAGAVYPVRVKTSFFCLFALLACCTAGAVYPVRVKTWWLVGVVCFALLCLLACCTAGAVHAVRFKTWWLVGVVCLLCLLAAPPTPGTRYSIVVFGHSPTSHKSGTCVWLCPG